ncbi:MAG TPA: hypothetical protein VMT01_02100 [Candidatus Acidoferrum sp.]|jgi:hypothetical protein|nr:hypothetical protein [Candidatus Acidoferrum sp.]
MRINYKKSLKIITLLVASILIASASAATYTYMYINGSVTISSTGLTWIKGDGASAGTTISGSTATVALSISNGTTTNFTNYLYMKNLDASTHSLMINITTAATASLYETNGFNISIYNNATQAYVGSLDVLSTSSYYSGTFPASGVWHFVFQVATKTDASGSDSFNVQFTYQ